MPVNKNQELYFATVVFMLLTIHFGGNAIYLLEEGKITDHGSFEDLSTRNSFFQKMLDHS